MSASVPPEGSCCDCDAEARSEHESCNQSRIPGVALPAKPNRDLFCRRNARDDAVAHHFVQTRRAIARKRVRIDARIEVDAPRSLVAGGGAHGTLINVVTVLLIVSECQPSTTPALDAADEREAFVLTPPVRVRRRPAAEVLPFAAICPNLSEAADAAAPVATICILTRLRALIDARCALIDVIAGDAIAFETVGTATSVVPV